MLSDEGCKKLEQHVASQSTGLNSISAENNQKFLELFWKYVLEESPNSSEKYISPRTIYNYKLKCNIITRSADTKNLERQKQFHNIRNSISLCALMYVLIQTVDPALIISSDDVSVILNGWENKPKVLTTKTSIKVDTYYLF